MKLLKFTVVVDNNVPPRANAPFRGEHGLSMLIETGTNRILFDTGASDLVVYNLGLLGVHPRDLDAIVLSHGHYDHTGGLAAVLTMAAKKFRCSVIRKYSNPDMPWLVPVAVISECHSSEIIWRVWGLISEAWKSLWN